MNILKSACFDVIVIGQGYAGLSAANLAVQRGLSTANFESVCMGGLIININELDPVPEGADHAGFELASNLAMENAELGVTNVSSAVMLIEPGENDLWLVKTASQAYASRHIVVASGASLRKLGIPGEKEFFGQGVSECADCDGPMFKGMETVVVGGGDSAFQEALALSEFADKITVVMRGDRPSARVDFLERAAANPKLILLTNSRVVAIEGEPDSGVKGIRIETAEKCQETLACSGVFIFIGLEPNTGFLPADMSRDSVGALVTSEQCATSLPGAWAIGAVRSGYGGLLTDAAADAERAVAALSKASA